ncbi:MAG TPA: hypothetical protein VGC42_17280 [Kofleriaceae bacterium]
MRTRLVLIVALAACGGAPAPAPAPVQPAVAPAPRPAAPRPAIEQRRDAACDQLGPKITACAVDDARAELAAGKLDKPAFDRDTAPAVQTKNTEKFIEDCKSHAYSSRQVRVLEVCFQQEPQCGPLLDCLGHLSDKP